MVLSKKKKSLSAMKEVPPSKTESQSLILIHGDDDFLVAEEARKIIALRTKNEMSGFGLEIVDGMASNQVEATAVFKKLFDSLQSQSFFATEKVVWWRNTNLMGSNTTASSSTVLDFLDALNQLFQQGLPSGISVVVTTTELDGRKTIAKTFAKMGRVIAFKIDPYKQKENQLRSLDFARQTAAKLNKELEEKAGLLLVEMSDGDSRTIQSEIEKISTYLGKEGVIREKELREIGSWRPGGIVWDLPDAIGNRDLDRALALIDDLLFIGESPTGLLFAMISRIRLLLLLSALVSKKLINPGSDYSSFKIQIERLPSWISENLPRDKKLNPLASHPFVLYKAVPGVTHYTSLELQEALHTLLECNEQLVSTGTNPKNILIGALIKICAAVKS